MNSRDNTVSVTEATHSLGSVSILSFLTEASREEVYRDPVEALYETEPTVSERPLSDIYTIDSVDDDLIHVEKRNTEFQLAKSFDLNFARLVGAAYIMASYSTTPDIDLRGGEHSAYSPKKTIIPLTTVSLTRPDELMSGPSQEVYAIFDFWSALDPQFNLIREIKASIPAEVARDLLDFDRMAEAMETGALSSRAESVEKITPKISALEAIDAIRSPKMLDDLLELLCGPVGTLPEIRGDIRLQFGDHLCRATLIPYGISNPLLETLLSNVFSLTPDDCGDERDQTWYLPGNSDIYDLVIPNDERLKTFVTEKHSGNGYDEIFGLTEDDSSIGRTDADIISSYPEELIPIPPSLILAGACNNQNTLSTSYAEVATVAGLVSGAGVWGDINDIIDRIEVVYDTLGKLARRRYCHFNEQADYSSDEYVTERLPVDAETASQLVTVTDLSDTESAEDVGSVQPGVTQKELRVGAGYISVRITEPAKLLCEYMIDATLHKIW